MEEITGEKRRAALLAGQRLFHAGYDAESTYARLEKEFGEEIAHQVIRDLYHYVKKIDEKQAETDNTAGLIWIGAGIVTAIISFVLAPNIFLIPILTIGAGIYMAVRARDRMAN